MKTKQSCTVELDLEETIPADTLAKLFKRCKERRLPWPDGILTLMKEVMEKQGRAKPEKQGRVKPEKQGRVKPEKQGRAKPERQGRAKLEKQVHAKPERQGRAKA